MHNSVMEHLKSSISENDIFGKSVLEVGSYNINGTARDAISKFLPKSYLGVDQGAGPCVDRVVDAATLVSVLGAEMFDVVVSTEMLEHAKDWRTVVGQIKGVLKSGGLLILTARGPGMPYHPCPGDFWRFTLDDVRKIFSDMEIVHLISDKELPGFMLRAIKPVNFKLADLSGVSVVEAVK